MNKNQDKGFTLIELLIVIVILGILAAITVFAIGAITETSQDSACDIEQRSIETAVDAIRIDQNNSYPAVGAAADTLSEAADSPFLGYYDAADIVDLNTRWDYAVVAADPVAGTPESFTLTGKGNCA